MISGERLRQARKDVQLSQQRLGELIGHDQQYVSKLERGVLPGMSVNTLERLAEALRVSTDFILSRTDDPRPRPRRATPMA